MSAPQPAQIARRLALLEGVALSQPDLAAVVAEFEDFDRALAELETFAEGVAWLDAPAKPNGSPAEARAGDPEDSLAAQPERFCHSERSEESVLRVRMPHHVRHDKRLCSLGAVALGRLIASREASATEAVDACLERLACSEGTLNAFITVMADQARARARQVDEEIARGHYRGPLHGIPVTIKDMFSTAGIRTTGGSKILADWLPDADSALVERLTEAGAIVIGKTNLDEFGHGGTSTLSHFGPVHNPWDPQRIAGGSSGGSTAAVAAGIGPLSYGTETGSSVRRPAAYCGVFGFKPTFGIVSRYGSFRGAWSMDHVGVFARSVADAAMGLAAVAGYDSRDPASVRVPPAHARVEARARGLKLGVPHRFLEGVAEPAIRDAFHAAIQTLAGLGAEIRDVDLPELSYAAMTSMLTSSAEASGNNVAWLRERPDDFVTEVRRRLASGLAITAAEYLTVQRARHRIRGAVSAAFEQVDLLVGPTTGRTAPTIADGPRGNGDQAYRASHNHSNLLRFPSMLGLPACSIPCGVSSEGLPIGLQMVGRWFDDQRVLQAAAAYERATEWHARRPALA